MVTVCLPMVRKLTTVTRVLKTVRNMCKPKFFLRGSLSQASLDIKKSFCHRGPET